MGHRQYQQGHQEDDQGDADDPVDSTDVRHGRQFARLRSVAGAPRPASGRRRLEATAVLTSQRTSPLPEKHSPSTITAGHPPAP
jgi:hypothetical protein